MEVSLHPHLPSLPPLKQIFGQAVGKRRGWGNGNKKQRCEVKGVYLHVHTLLVIGKGCALGRSKDLG